MLVFLSERERFSFLPNLVQENSNKLQSCKNEIIALEIQNIYIKVITS